MEIYLFDTSVLLLSHALLITSVIGGLLLHASYFWKYRSVLGALVTCMIGASVGLMLVSGTVWWLVLLYVIIQGYRLFSILRVVKNRVNEKSLKNKSLRSEAFLGTLLLVVLIFDQLALLSGIDLSMALLVISSIQLIIATIFLLHAKRSYKVTAIFPNLTQRNQSELPSLSVCVPARNETDELNGCIRSILSSDYPKLEVLVIDDCSQDNTSEIIKKFAHRGVRFIAGKTPPESWLAKNYAYHQLLDEAGGKLVLFCGTDVRFEPNSFRLMTGALLQNHKKMISILPTRKDTSFEHFLLQPMRYWRELAIPKLFDKTPPVLSTCWMAERTFLNETGGFAAHKKTVRPERIISRSAALSNNYAFIRSTSGYGISSIKKLRAQWDTAKRTRYPEHHNRPENVMISSLILAFTMLGSGVALAMSIFYAQYFAAGLALISIVFLLITHFIVNQTSGSTRKLIRSLLFPVSVIMEIVVTNYSMWAYEFSEVLWKGRNVCLPVLQAIPSLPKINDRNQTSE